MVYAAVWQLLLSRLQPFGATHHVQNEKHAGKGDEDTCCEYHDIS